MGHFRNPAGVARAATIALFLYMVFNLVSAVLLILVPPDPVEPGLADLPALPQFVSLLACFFLVGRGIYVTNANAHVFDPEMSIGPGWAVGWFFIPFANLVMPYQGVSQTWRASHAAAGLDGEAEMALLRWWWGLWLATNILSTLAARMSGGWTEVPNGAGAYIELVAALLNVPLCLILIALIRRLTRVQIDAHNGITFA